MPFKIIKLRPIKESTKDYEDIEKRIKQAFWDIMYAPIIKDLGVPRETIQNADDPLGDAIRSGRVMFSYGRFSGRFSAGISRELKRLGATWEKKTETFRILKSQLPKPIQDTIAASSARFNEKLKKIDSVLAQNLPAKIAEQLKLTKLFDSTLWKVDREFGKTIENITIAPSLPAHRRQKIAEEWQDNMELWIKTFTEDEISELRKKVQKSAFAGNRYEALINMIRDSYGVTQNKAKFLARQETSLLMTKFKESRYQDAGINEYEWRCVAGSANHPVRPSHKSLEGKTFRWDDPPITTEPGEPVRRNNPGQDYNCRCFAKPIVKFRKE